MKVVGAILVDLVLAVAIADLVAAVVVVAVADDRLLGLRYHDQLIV